MNSPNIKRHYFIEENTIIILIASIYKDFDSKRILLTLSDTKKKPERVKFTFNLHRQILDYIGLIFK